MYIKVQAIITIHLIPDKNLSLHCVTKFSLMITIFRLYPNYNAGQFISANLLQ